MARTKSVVKRGMSDRGRWITLEEAKENSVGKEEWWKIAGADGTVVEVKQYVVNAPQGQPIFSYRDGSMYLGEWNETKSKQHGFGVYYHNTDPRHRLGTYYEYKGLIYVGNWADDEYHGLGKEVWLKSAPAWKKNEFLGSEIKQPTDAPSGVVGRPFNYSGLFRDGSMHDPAATVSLKDGSMRQGPWEDGEPVGDWWSDHQSVVAAGATSHDNSDGETKETATAKPATSLKAYRRSDDATGATSAKKARTLQSAPVKVKKEPETASGTGKAAAAVSGPASNNKKQRPPDDSSDEQADAVVSNASAAEEEVDVAANPAEPDKRVKGICKWLARVIGHNPVPTEMEAYAQTFFDRGFHSVGMIRAYCTAEHLDFMKLAHRLSFLDKIAKLP